MAMKATTTETVLGKVVVTTTHRHVTVAEVRRMIRGYPDDWVVCVDAMGTVFKVRSVIGDHPTEGK